MEHHDWKKTHWMDEQGKTVTIQDLLFDMQEEPAIAIKISDLSHIPSIRLENYRIRIANLCYPIVVQEKDGVYQSILDGHHRRQRAIEEKRTHILVKIFKGDLFYENR